ncbi:hypothetical protein F2P81_007350 [Scophthalmus maximus]|uniref:Uncharacterized protein n=1 Tax=Scophthalmus maximus TaxID=52904 RepID=A0A6A4TH63_SCOMX|nr:hypothetical protein F2P81_007350 [Scophthalmus maximus]
MDAVDSLISLHSSYGVQGMCGEWEHSECGPQVNVCLHHQSAVPSRSIALLNFPTRVRQGEPTERGPDLDDSDRLRRDGAESNGPQQDMFNSPMRVIVTLLLNNGDATTRLQSEAAMD